MGNPELAAAWDNLRKAFDAVATLIQPEIGAGSTAPATVPDSGTAAPVTTPTPPSPPLPGFPEPDLAAREAHVMSAIGGIAQMVAERSSQIQAAMTNYMNSGMPCPPQLLGSQIQVYMAAIQAFGMQRPEAQSLADAGRKQPQQLLDQHVADCTQAMQIFQNMIGQGQEFANNQALIMADAGRSVTQTILDVTGKMRDTYSAANKKFADYLRS